MYFLLYSHNQVVLGAEKSAIYDLDNGKIVYIPNVLVTVLEEMRNKKVADIKKQYTPDNPEIIDRYVQFLVQNGLGFYTEEPKQFPKLALDFNYPGVLRDAALESDMTAYNLKGILLDLERLGCRYIELRLDLKEKPDFDTLTDLFESIKETLFVSITLLMKYNEEISMQDLENLYDSYSKIKKVLIHTAPLEKGLSNPVQFVKETLAQLENNSKNTDKYIVNIPYFSESLQYNTLYNKKVAINYDGDIKNILNDSRTFGNVKQTSLQEVVNSTEFQRYWTVSPDKIEGIKESELRYAMYTPNPLVETPEGSYELQS